MSPEDQLCLLLARGRLSPESEQRARELLAASLAWNRILERIRAHQILPLVCHNLERLGFPYVPEPVRAELANLFRSNAVRNLLLGQELARVLALLGDARVPVMPLKGTALAESLYGDPALRVCADVDVLVPPKCVAQAFQLLLASGYDPGFTQPPLVELLARYGKDCLLIRQDRTGTYPLQLHCGLVWGGPVERDLLDEIWSQAGRRTFYGVPAFTLSADWEFLYLAVHAARHGLLPLKWLADLDRLCSQGTVDWGHVQEKAGTLAWEGAVQSCLSACASLFDTPISPLFSRTDSGVRQRFQTPPSSSLQIPREVLFSAKLLKSRYRRVHFLATRLFVPTPADCRFLPLPSSLFFLYYFLRPLRLACLTIGWLVKRGTGN